LREREEAIRIAQQLAEENKKLQGSLGQGQAALLEQAKKVVANELEDAERVFKAAYEAGDAEALAAANKALTKAQIKAEKVNNFKPAPLQQTETPVQIAPQPQQVQVDPKARAWHEANPWFMVNKKMTSYAYAVHDELVEKGVNPNSDEYYEQINAEVKKVFPDAFPSEKPKTKAVVAPATRSTAPKKIVLTQSQVSIAKRLGVPLELYAKKVAEEMRKQNG
jgi:hypothetical protein